MATITSVISSPTSVHLGLKKLPPTKLGPSSDKHLDAVHVQVRPFQDADLQQVRDLFIKAMVAGTGSPMQTMLNSLSTKPTSYFAYSLFGTGLILLARHAWMPGATACLAAIATFIGYRWFISYTFMDLMNKNLQADLKDIRNHYRLNVLSGGPQTMPSGPSGFWVVESSSPGNVKEIIGAVGLDYYKNNEEGNAEMRRMVVSPEHRRQGVGAMLLRTLIAHAKEHNLSSVYLTTSTYQAAAINMYKKFGWVQTSERQVSVAFGLLTATIPKLELFLTKN